jgi:protein SCO1
MKISLWLVLAITCLCSFRDPDEKKYLGRKIADVELMDHEGRKFMLFSLLKDKPLVISPIYTKCPSACSMISGGLKKSVEDLGKVRQQFNLLTFSFDSADKEEDLSGFAKRWKMDGQQWKMSTATEKENILTLLNSLDFHFEKDGREYQHPNVVIVITPSGRISRYIYGIEPKAKDLELAVRIAATEKTAPGVFDGMYLKCFRFDPLTKTYILDWGFIISTFAGLVIIAIVSSIMIKSFILK